LQKYTLAGIIDAGYNVSKCTGICAGSNASGSIGPSIFITNVHFPSKAILASNKVAGIIIDEWRNAHNRHGWAIGRSVIIA